MIITYLDFRSTNPTPEALMLLIMLSILLGWLAGYFLTVPLMVLISVGCLIIVIIMSIRLQEMAGLVTVIFAALASIGNLVMWATYYIVTDQTFLGDFVQKYITR